MGVPMGQIAKRFGYTANAIARRTNLAILDPPGGA